MKLRDLTVPGSILLDGIAIVVTLFLLWRADRKQAAVGRRYVVEIQSRYQLLIESQRIPVILDRLHNYFHM